MGRRSISFRNPLPVLFFHHVCDWMDGLTSICSFLDAAIEALVTSE
jgi:hypothetical protein